MVANMTSQLTFSGRKKRIFCWILHLQFGQRCRFSWLRHCSQKVWPQGTNTCETSNEMQIWQSSDPCSRLRVSLQDADSNLTKVRMKELETSDAAEQLKNTTYTQTSLHVGLHWFADYWLPTPRFVASFPTSDVKSHHFRQKELWLKIITVSVPAARETQAALRGQVGRPKRP